MEQRRAILVIQENDCSEYGHSETILGLLTLSDLNRRPLKVNLFYDGHVEAKLAAIVEGAYPDGWTWINMLNENSQAILLGIGHSQGIGESTWSTWPRRGLVGAYHACDREE